MAQKIITVYTDDLTGAESSEAQTHHFSIDGVGYEIDLSPESFDQMLEAFGPFMEAARKQGKGSKRPSGRIAPSRRSEDTARIRSWAKENGYNINDRGRVPADIRNAYTAAAKQH